MTNMLLSAARSSSRHAVPHLFVQFELEVGEIPVELELTDSPERPAGVRQQHKVVEQEHHHLAAALGLTEHTHSGGHD